MAKFRVTVEKTLFGYVDVEIPDEEFFKDDNTRRQKLLLKKEGKKNLDKAVWDDEHCFWSDEPYVGCGGQRLDEEVTK